MDYKETLYKYQSRFNTELNKFPALKELEQRSQIPKSYLVIGVVGVYLLLVWLNIGGIGGFFANLASVGIAGYYSLEALETEGKADDTQFLTYWVVYAAFTILEFWSSFILYWIPGYWLFKTIFFLWLGLPAFSGARYVYASLLRPFSVKFLGIKPSRKTVLDEHIRPSTATHTGSSL